MEGLSFCDECECSMPQDDYLANKGLCEECELKQADCLECSKKFIQERDLQVCDVCVKLFDLDKLWELHDLNELDALDFNESKEFRGRFRI